MRVVNQWMTTALARRRARRTVKDSFTVAALLPLLAACAGPKLTPIDAEIMAVQAQARQACYQAQAVRYQSHNTIPDARDRALIIMAEALAGRGGDACPAETNAYDARARIAEAQNRAAEGVTRSVVSGAIIGTGIVAGADVLKTAINNAGTHTNTNMIGDGNSSSHTSYDTRANTENNLSTRGDNSPVAANNPPVSGPDQSHTEIHEAPPEPEVPETPVP